jgi:hypothetical protein
VKRNGDLQRGGVETGQQVTRRQILKFGILGAVAVPVVRGVTTLGRSTAKTGTADLGRLSQAAFEKQVGTPFVLHHPTAGRLTATLAAVTPLDRPSGATGEGFDLKFTARVREGFGQETYSVANAAMGSFPLLLVPGADGHTAVINRMFR